MPGTDMPLEKLRAYRGSSPYPGDFASFWDAVQKELAALDPAPVLERVELPNAWGTHARVTIRAMDGCLLRAKYIRPVGADPVPGVLQFHDYPDASRSWFHLTRYLAVGRAVLAPDCRGQGGMSENGPAGPGPAGGGPMFQGLDGDVRELYLFKLICDSLLWARVLTELEGIGKSGLTVYGEGQGGGLAVACAALVPGFSKCAAHYPLLCDYKRVWDKDFDTGAYEGLRYYFRWHDPLHEREEEIFRKLAYVDVKNFAPRLSCRVLVGTGLQDTVSPPSAQFALVNGMKTGVRHAVYPKHGHELNNFFENELLRFILEP